MGKPGQRKVFFLAAFANLADANKGRIKDSASATTSNFS